MKKLTDFEPLTSTLLRWLAKDTRFTCRPSLATVLAENPSLILVFTHSSPLSWVLPPCLLAAHACARGGGHRRPMGVVDRFFYIIPGLKGLAAFLSQSDRGADFDSLSAHLRASGDIVLFPEGSNCFFGDPNQVQSFRSNRFIELSLQTGAPLLICAHRGTEDWGKRVAFAESWLDPIKQIPFVFEFLDQYLRFESRIKESGALTIPKIPHQVERLDMVCEIFIPAAGEDRTSEDRNSMIEREAQKVKARMSVLLQELDQNRIRDGIAELPPGFTQDSARATDQVHQS